MRSAWTSFIRNAVELLERRNASAVLLLSLILSILISSCKSSDLLLPETHEYSEMKPMLNSKSDNLPVLPGQQEAEPLPLLTICPGGVSFCENGQATLLRGADAPHLLWGESPGSWQWAGLDRLKEDVSALRSWGGNFVIINFDPGRVADAEYAGRVVAAAQYAHSIGLHVELMQHHSKWSLQDGKPVFVPLPIQDANPPELTTDVDLRWMALLSHPGVAESLSSSVDVYGIFSEPDQQLNTGLPFETTSEISWIHWRPRAEKACQDIRAWVKRQAICSISGTDWAWDVRGYLSDPFQIPSAALEVHQYQNSEAGSEITILNIFGFQLKRYEPGVNRAEDWMPLAGKVPMIMGEFGDDDPPDYVRGLLSDLEKNQISWAAWSLIGWYPKEGMIDCQTRTILPLGEVVKSTLGGVAHPVAGRRLSGELGLANDPSASPGTPRPHTLHGPRRR
jgi:hypothetical protein